QSTISRTVKRFNELGSYWRTPGQGHKQSTDARDERYLMQVALRNRCSASLERSLNEGGLDSRRPAITPLLTREYRVTRCLLQGNIEHLDKHNSQHFQKFLSYCIYCSEEFRNKKLYEEHLNEHLIHSFPCIYCDKFFLRKQLCENHIREQHPGRKKKIKRIKPQSILDRIDKYPDQREEPNDIHVKNKPEEFVVKILCQPGQQEDSSTNDEDLIDANCEDVVNESYLDDDTQVTTNMDVDLSNNR
ncbi:hypothetical protein ILUMI_01057, partial [Ignelater luminosus]